ncbi:TetR/AcrR family transcriptional regulator [Streptomyces sp. Tu 3180]|uniref:TetR/AcrR family transcriptional regulator n=1 Tax=Streptomyces sp. Tu 3180 TaxID=2682611 RepID=UPI00135C6CF0|nr:TetR/AcrR family transcriptional regulator [Streptomyces sp. Tu 3180]KAF3463205.1 TetR/AcrR family transcriptional regulator [Streptomyces sp. Tu 3180]
MPKLWTETIDAHRAAVRAAVLDAAAALVAEHGLASVTMSRIAKDSGIGRATLYKYFPDVESILLAWHERQVGHHLEHLVQVRDRSADAGERLEAVLRAYALITHDMGHHHVSGLAAVLHSGPRVVQAQGQLHRMIEELLADGAHQGSVRGDIAPGELASYCLHALAAAGGLSSPAAVHRLVTVTLAGVHPAAAPAADHAPHTGASAHSPRSFGHRPGPASHRHG